MHRDGKLIGREARGLSSPDRLSVANDAEDRVGLTDEFIPRADNFEQIHARPQTEGASEDRRAPDQDPTVALVALADPVRLQLVKRLAEGPCSVRRLAEGFPVSRAAISQHLKVMLNLGVVAYCKHGPLNIYSLNPEPLKRLQSYLEDLSRTAVQSAEAWRRRASWFERI